MFSSVFVCVFFCYILFIWITDVISFLGFYAGCAAKALWPALLAGVFMLPVLRQMIRRKPWNREKLFSGWDMAAAACFCLFAAGKMVFPDMSEDVCKYHVFLQDPSWKDMIGFHLLPGGIQGFGFPLGDRMFYLFRRLLGYRLGTVLNLLCLLLIYSQARKIMRELCGSRFEKLSPFLCFLAVTQYDAIMQVGSYMVELIGTCILLECVWFLLHGPEDGKEMVVFAGLMGFLFAVKMTNIVYVIPLVILYIFKNKKWITARIFCLCFLAGALPVSIYLIHNWIRTGNPVYPYYNRIFRSPYFADMNFKDKRWGGQNWIEVLLWPFIGIKRPDYRQSELPAPYTWGYASAWLLLAACGAEQFLKKSRDQAKLGYMAGFIIASSLLWSASTGHVRYYMGGFILLMITGISAGICCMGQRKVTDGLLMCVMAVMIPGPFLVLQTCARGAEWSFRPGLSDHILPGGIPIGAENLQEYKNQLKVMGKDRKAGTPEQRERPGKLVLFESDGMIAALMDMRIPVVLWDSVCTTMGDDMFEAFCRQMEGELESSDRIYGIVRCKKGQNPGIDKIMEQRFAVKSMEALSQNIFLNNEFYLVRLKNPKDPMNRLDRTRAAGVLGTEKGSLAQIPPGKDMTLWIETPGLETGPGLEQESLSHVKLRIMRKREEEETILLEKELDLREQELFEIRLDFSHEKEPVFLYGMLELPDSDENLSSYARVWIRTSLTGRQIFPNAAYYTGESGVIETGWVEDGGGRYYTDGFGKLYTGWKQIDKKWYYFSKDGSMYTGWLDGEYYLDEDGVMVTGTRIIDGVTYEFDDSGSLCSQNP